MSESGTLARELCQALITVVADLAFITLLEDARDYLYTESDDYLKMMLPVVQPYKGTFLLAVELSLLREITCNIYGTEEEQLTRESELDTLGELLNTMGGRVMRIVVPPTVEYELGLPLPVENNSAPVGEPAMNFTYHSEERRLIFSIVGQSLIDEVIR